MMKFRLITGENGTKWGKQTVVYSAKAENAIEFVKEALTHFNPIDQLAVLDTTWVDAGPGTIAIDVQNLVIY